MRVDPITGIIDNIILSPEGTKIPPVLQNAAGEPVLDTAGRPFVLGEGGIPHFMTYTTTDGLALDKIACSYMDRAGHLWFGTWGGGVSRCDGTSFTTYTTAQGLAGSFVFSIAEDQAGHLWVGTDGGLSFLSRSPMGKAEGQRFQSFSKASKNQPSRHFAENRIFN